MSKEWFIEEYEEKEYLHDRILQFLKYPAEPGEHDHCELCWERFSSYEEDQQDGYYEENSRSWICGKCFRNFKELFRWKITNNHAD